MTIPYANGGGLGANYAQVYSTSSSLYPYVGDIPFQVGQLSEGTDGSKWIFVKFGTGGVTGLGYVCTYDEDFLAVMMSNSVGGLGDKLGVAPAAALINQYGWLQVYGTCDDIRVSASCAANVVLASTVTAGEIDDAVATPTKNITGIVLTTARAASAGNAPGELNWPVIGTTN
ncbi:hypothetical protein [Tardiphaga sp. 841_E9_N1_2]|uniref:hypothetical protein n=1 Tax=Tardiphaga sp. 841_E9_N1_2 TaxID=3240762 RepID=UPI003F26B6C2